MNLIDLCILFKAGKQWLHTTMAARRKKITQHFDDLEHCYFSVREREVMGDSNTATSSDSQSNSIINTPGMITYPINTSPPYAYPTHLPHHTINTLSSNIFIVNI